MSDTATDTVTPRKHTKFVTCDNHRWIDGERRERRAEIFGEGGPGYGPPCGPDEQRCQMWAGTDLFIPEVCDGPYLGVHASQWAVNQ